MHSINLLDGESKEYESFQTPWLSELWNFDIRCVKIEIADALLVDLGLSRTTKMIDMQKMGDCFVCCRCAAEFCKLMSWFEIVRAITAYAYN